MNKHKFTVYKIINNITKEFYIGSTVDFVYRIWCHKRDLNNNKHHSPILQNSWNKYKGKNFSFEIIEDIEDKNKLIEREQYWINLLKPKFNCSLIAGSPLGVKHTLQSRMNMSKAHKGKSLNHKLNCICGVCKSIRGENFGENAPHFGKRHTENTINTIKEFRKKQISPFEGKHHTEETKQKIRDKLIGRLR